MKKFILIVFVSLFLTGLFVLQGVAANQIKTTETFIGESASQMLSGIQINKVFSIYIGDSIDNVSSSVKSVPIVVTGVYTGTGGTLTLSLDSNSATIQTFNFASVSNPTPFEVLYNDPSHKINPTSAGTYSYTLNILPTNITLSGMAAKVIMSYESIPSSCPDGAATNEKIKTTETFIGNSAAQISGSSFNPSFSLYIGDNISGVTNSIKSAVIAVSGVYTGSGSLELRLNNNSSSSQVVTFTNVTNPTSFEILYKDPTETINPTSPGTYTYTLNVIPTGITISGFGAKAVMSYRYKPPACGGSLPPYGELISPLFDSGVNSGAAYNSIMWRGTVNGGTGKVTFQFAAADSPAGPWYFYGDDGSGCGSSATGNTKYYSPSGPDTPSELSCALAFHNNKRYYKYKVRICAESDCASSLPTSVSPTVDDVIISWSP
jgi:hypothetical protein